MQRGGSGLCLAALVVIALFVSGSDALPQPTQDCIPPPPGLVNWWTGNGTADDIQGNNDGALHNGATFGSGMVGQAFSFDGIDDYVQIAQRTFDGLEEVTVDAWVKFDVLDAPNSDAQTIISALHSGVAHYWTLLKTDASTLDLSFLSAQGNCNFTFVSQAFPFQVGRFYHIAATQADGLVTLYIDGNEILSQVTNCTGGVRANTGTTLIGGQDPIVGSSIARPLDGMIDELEIFNRALSTFEIQALFNAGSAGKCTSPDADEDGVPDAEDQCLDSTVTPTVVIGGCDSRVFNPVFPSGCTIFDSVHQCADGADNHGQFVSCVAHLTNELKRAGVITGQQKGAIQGCAAQAEVP